MSNHNEKWITVPHQTPPFPPLWYAGMPYSKIIESVVREAWNNKITVQDQNSTVILLKCTHLCGVRSKRGVCKKIQRGSLKSQLLSHRNFRALNVSLSQMPKFAPIHLKLTCYSSWHNPNLFIDSMAVFGYYDQHKSDRLMQLVLCSHTPRLQTHI